MPAYIYISHKNSDSSEEVYLMWNVTTEQVV